MAARVKKEPKPLELKIPAKAEDIDRWVILGLDPSLSRTGYSIMLCESDGKATWLSVGSVAPATSSDPIWIRSKALGLAARDILCRTFTAIPPRTGLIISFEFPTPQNDFLTSLSRILSLTFFEEGSVMHGFERVHVQMTNASTLRSLMGLTKTGAKNKTENIAKAYEFLDQASYPNLDTDACDAILMAMMARYSALILQGRSESVPPRFLTSLCNAETEVKGKGRNAKLRTKGLLHRPEYWLTYQRKTYEIELRDAREKKRKLDRLTFTI